MDCSVHLAAPTQYLHSSVVLLCRCVSQIPMMWSRRARVLSHKAFGGLMAPPRARARRRGAGVLQRLARPWHRAKMVGVVCRTGMPVGCRGRPHAGAGSARAIAGRANSRAPVRCTTATARSPTAGPVSGLSARPRPGRSATAPAARRERAPANGPQPLLSRLARAPGPQAANDHPHGRRGGSARRPPGNAPGRSHAHPCGTDRQPTGHGLFPGVNATVWSAVSGLHARFRRLPHLPIPSLRRIYCIVVFNPWCVDSLP